MKRNFSEDLDCNIPKLSQPEEAFACKNVHCKKESHRNDIETYTENLIEAINHSAKNELAFTGGAKKEKKNVVPGWDEFVKPY